MNRPIKMIGAYAQGHRWYDHGALPRCGQTLEFRRPKSCGTDREICRNELSLWQVVQLPDRFVRADKCWRVHSWTGYRFLVRCGGFIVSRRHELDVNLNCFLFSLKRYRLSAAGDDLSPAVTGRTPLKRAEGSGLKTVRRTPLRAARTSA